MQCRDACGNVLYHYVPFKKHNGGEAASSSNGDLTRVVFLVWSVEEGGKDDIHYLKDKQEAAGFLLVLIYLLHT